MRFVVALALALGTLCACHRDRAPDSLDGAAPTTGTGSTTSASSFGALGPLPPAERSPDGLAILRVKPKASDATPNVRILGKSARAMETLARSASDGARVYFAVGADGSDLMVRDGAVYEGVLAGLGVEKGGCAAARDGELLLSGVVPTDGNQKAQAVFRISVDGKTTKTLLPAAVGQKDDCRAWLGTNGTYALGLGGIVTWDGKSFQEDREVFTGRMTLGSPTSPRYCFHSCNAAEEAKNPPDTREIAKKLDCKYQALVAYDAWLGGACSGRALRKAPNGELQVTEGLPPSHMLSGHYDSVFTASGDLVLGLEYGYRKYVVWRAGEKSPGPIRDLPPGAILANASPTFLVEGLISGAPEATTSAVLLGKDIGWGTGGSTLGYSAIRRSADAHRAASGRARAVLGEGTHLVAHEAVIDSKCGAYVRSPLGHENMTVHDWQPPVLPALAAKAVTRPSKCQPVASVVALPGDPDLLLGLSDKSELLAAWLPPSLPLPGGTGFGVRKEVKERPKPPEPRPGTGWSIVGQASEIEGIPGVPAPGADTDIPSHSWQAGGGAIVRASGVVVLVTPRGVVTLPPSTKPMAIGTTPKMHVWGAVDGTLVECTKICRILDPGVPDSIVAVVPRTETTLLLGYADGRVAVYTVPPQGGREVPVSALATTLEGWLAKKPIDATP